MSQTRDLNIAFSVSLAFHFILIVLQLIDRVLNWQIRGLNRLSGDGHLLDYHTVILRGAFAGLIVANAELSGYRIVDLKVYGALNQLVYFFFAILVDGHWSSVFQCHMLDLLNSLLLLQVRLFEPFEKLLLITFQLSRFAVFSADSE